MDTQPLDKQNALIVGGGTGIGRAVAEGLAALGCQTAVAGRRKDKLEAVCQAYDGPGRILCHEVDVSDRDSLQSLVAWFNQEVGNIDILVNAAGMNIKNRTMAEMQPEQFDQVMAINATGAYNCLAAVLPQMRQRQRGTVINISSIAGKRAIDLGGVAYCASKFAMTALGTAVGQEEAPNGIRITNVYPGEVDTPLLEQRPKPVSAEHRARMLQPEDVAEMVVAICRLPLRAHVPEIVVKPRLQAYF
jgi:NADP-dependent 3-hydroxy acid dehydrogenase YdfG